MEKTGKDYRMSINTSQEIGDQFKALLSEKFTPEKGNLSDGLVNLMEFIKGSQEASDLKARGYDSDGMKAAIDSVWNIYIACANGRDELILKKDKTIASLKDALAEAEAHTAEAIRMKEAADAEMNKASRETRTVNALIEAKDTEIARLKKALSGNDEAKAEVVDLKEQLHAERLKALEAQSELKSRIAALEAENSLLKALYNKDMK